MRDINIFDTEMFPYLEGEEIKGSTLTLTIKDMRQEKLISNNGRNEKKEVLYFAETPKGFVLNKTNAKRIAQMYGAMTGQWQGKQITLTTEEVQAFGELHNALRVVPGVIGSNGGDEMTLANLLAKLNKVTRISGFYSSPDDIMACRSKGAVPPPVDDLDGWRQLYTDARDYALDTIQAAVDEGVPVPAEAEAETETDDAEKEFYARTTVELGLKDEEAQAILRELGYTSFNPATQGEELINALDAQLNQSPSTPTALLVLANRETGGHYKHIKHLENAIKKLDLGIEYPPAPDQPIHWRTLLAGLVDHGHAPKENK